MSRSCPLCQTLASQSVRHAHHPEKDYGHCPSCDLIFLHSEYLPLPMAERSRYALHTNSLNDVGYVSHLKKIWDPVKKFLFQGAEGLDFGCGPGPTLSRLIETEGYTCENFDPYFFPEGRLLQREYDFLLSTEVVEHFHNPIKSWSVMRNLIKPDGVVGVMTHFHQGLESFVDWHYAKDPTHVVFYSEKTFRWLAHRFGLEILACEHPIAILRART